MGLYERRWLKAALQLAGVVLFALILTRIDIRRVLVSFRSIDPPWAAFTVCIVLLLTLVKGIRWRMIVAAQGTHVSVARSYSVYAAGLYLGVVTPGRVGDFVKSLYLMNTGMKAGKALFSSLVDRLFDIILLAVIGYTSLLFFPGIFENQLLLSTLVLGIVAAASIAVFWRRDLLTGIVRRFVSTASPKRMKPKLDRTISEVIAEFSLMDGYLAAKTVVLTCVAWALHLLAFVLFARALSIGVGVPVLIVSVSAAVFTALIPVSLSGLGTRDLVLILIFERVGLSREDAVTFSLTFVLVYLVQGIVGLVCWLTGPLHRPAQTTGAGEEER